MTRYYDKRVSKVIDTANEIPEDLLAKKTFLLPVAITEERIQDTDTPKKEAGEYLTDTEYTIHNVIKYHVDTLEEAKEKKIQSLKEYIAPKFPETFKQINAILGEYDEEKNQDIKYSVSGWRAYIDTFEQKILDCTTIEELDLIDYKTEEDIAKELVAFKELSEE